MTFNFKLMFLVVYKSFFHAKATPARLSPKRCLSLLLFLSGYVVMELINWLGFLFDSIFFAKYKQIQVKEPVFITGNPRSGTTFLHRLLAKDQDSFTSMKYWEIMFAPSVTQKLFWKTVGKIDQRLGGSLTQCVLKLEDIIFDKYNKMHKTSLFEYDEDELVLFHIFSSVWIIFIFPFEKDFCSFGRFDKELSAKQRSQIMKFYKRCVQCHLYVFGKGKRLLSKNPTFSPKIVSLGETFPDAKIICLIRSPLEVVPSSFSMASLLYKFYNHPIGPYPMGNFTFDLLAYWYDYPVQQLETWDSNRQKILKYTTLTQNPEQTVIDIYDRFGLNISSQYHQVLREEALNSRKFKSCHKYSDKQCGLSREQIISYYSNIFDRFGFNTGDTFK